MESNSERLGLKVKVIFKCDDLQSFLFSKHKIISNVFRREGDWNQIKIKMTEGKLNYLRQNFYCLTLIIEIHENEKFEDGEGRGLHGDSDSWSIP